MNRKRIRRAVTMDAAMAWYATAPLPVIEQELRDADVDVDCGRALFRALVNRRRRVRRAKQGVAGTVLAMVIALLVPAVERWVRSPEVSTLPTPVVSVSPAEHPVASLLRAATFKSLALDYSAKELAKPFSPASDEFSQVGLVLAMTDNKEPFEQWSHMASTWLTGIGAEGSGIEAGVDPSNAVARITLAYYIAGNNDRFDAASRPQYCSYAHTFAASLLGSANKYSEDVAITFLASYAQTDDERFLVRTRSMIEDYLLAQTYTDASHWSADDYGHALSLLRVAHYARLARVDLGPGVRSYEEAWVNATLAHSRFGSPETELWAGMTCGPETIGTRFDAVAATVTAGTARSPADSLRAMGAALGRDVIAFRRA